MSNGPGPQERKWSSRLRFCLLGSWGPAVVAERLARADSRVDYSNVDNIMRDVWGDRYPEYEAMVRRERKR